MNFKNFITLSIVSICVSSSAKGMEEIVKNQVTPAVGIVAIGTASVASNIAYNAVDKLCRKNDIFIGHRPSLKESVLTGGTFGLFSLVAKPTLSEISKISLPKLALVSLVPFALCTGLAVWSNKRYEDKLRQNPSDATATTSLLINRKNFCLGKQLQIVQMLSAIFTTIGIKILSDLQNAKK